MGEMRGGYVKPVVERPGVDEHDDCSDSQCISCEDGCDRFI